MLAGSAGFFVLNGHLDILVLGILRPVDEVGHYRVAVQLAALSGFTYAVFNMIAMQRFADLLARGAHEGLARSSTFMARLSTLGALPLPVVFWFWGAPILVWLFGPGFEAALAPTLILAAGQILNAATGFARTALVMMHREGLVLGVGAFVAGFNLAGCLALIPLIGTVGAALASVMSTAVWNAVLLRFAARLTAFDGSILGFARRPAHGSVKGGSGHRNV